LAKTLAKGPDQVLRELQHNGRYTLLTDAVAALEWWACFQPEEASRPVEPSPTTPVEPYRRANPKVGRNEPCPCGSGRKFKKCCGAV
jgi:preprotein translocase subunit SecA